MSHSVRGFWPAELHSFNGEEIVARVEQDRWLDKIIQTIGVCKGFPNEQVNHLQVCKAPLVTPWAIPLDAMTARRKILQWTYAIEVCSKSSRFLGSTTTDSSNISLKANIPAVYCQLKGQSCPLKAKIQLIYGLPLSCTCDIFNIHFFFQANTEKLFTLADPLNPQAPARQFFHLLPCLESFRFKTNVKPLSHLLQKSKGQSTDGAQARTGHLAHRAFAQWTTPRCSHLIVPVA